MAVEVSRDAAELAERMLADAYELVVSGWCQGAGAQDELGRAVEPSSAFARRWSAAGAIERIWQRGVDDPDVALEAFGRANLALAAAVKDVPRRWNDHPSRTRGEVLVALADARSYLGAPSQEPLELVEDLLDAADGHDPIPGFLFERSA